MSNSLRIRVLNQLIHELTRRGHSVPPQVKVRMQEVLELIDRVRWRTRLEELLDAIEARDCCRSARGT